MSTYSHLWIHASQIRSNRTCNIDAHITLGIMNKIQTYLARSHLSRVLERPCETLVPRSGDRGARVNCFSVFIDRADGEPYLLARTLDGDKLKCLEWNGSKYDIEREVDLRDVNGSAVTVTHFYGLSEVRYSGVLDLAIGRTFFGPYIKIHAVRTLSSIDQYFFNKKKLVTKQRIDLLKFLVAMHLDGKEEIHPISLMTGLYSIKWVMHPDRESQRRKLDFYLKSLVHTGELSAIDSGYKLTGHALRAIEDYEEQERKHTENVKIQRRVMWLTLAIALLTGAQADLYRFPTLVDFSSAQ